LTDDELQNINAAKLVCVLAIPGVVFAGLCGIYISRPDWPGMFGTLLAPMPSITVVFLQRMKASRRKLKAACGGFGWGFASFLVYFIWHSLMVELNYQLAQEETALNGD